MGIQEVFSTMDAMLFCQKARKTGNNVVKIPQAFPDIAWLKCFPVLNLFKYMYVFDVIQNWGTNGLQLYS